MNEWVNKAFSLDIDYNNHIINHVLFYNINLCIWFTTFHIAYPVLYSVLMIDNELLKGNQYWKSHKTYIKCRSWYVNSNCTELTHSYSSGQQRTAAPAAAAARSGTATAACRRPKILPTVSEIDRRQAVLSQMPCQELTQLHAVQSPEPPAWHTARPTIT